MTPAPWSISNGPIIANRAGYTVSHDDGDVASVFTLEDAQAIAALPEANALIAQLWGSLNFILAFYEPGQRHLDTEAWKNAEASGRRSHAAARAYLDALSKLEGKP